MNWLERLNQSPGKIALGQGTVELLSWAHAPFLASNQPHRHTFFEVCRVGSHGAGTFWTEGKRGDIGPGDVFFARPGVVHQITNAAEPGMELFWVAFGWMPSLNETASDVDALFRAFANSPVMLTSDEDGRIAQLWTTLQTVAGGRARPGWEAQTQAVISALLLALAQAGAGPDAPPAAEVVRVEPGAASARLAVRFIHDNLSRPLSLAEIAAHAHTSPRHLSRVFEKFAGASPAVYVTRARLDRAAALLRSGDLPIKQIAEAVGYPDIHHFSRLFSRFAGCPPGVYRRDPEARPVPIIQKPGALV